MRFCLAALALFATTAAACTSATDGHDPDARPGTAAPVAATDFDVALASALCQLWVRCGEANDLASCAAAAPMLSPAQRAQRLTDIADGEIVYDADAAGECLARITGAACTETQLASVDGALAACPAVGRGAQPNDTSCTHDAACASTYCEPDPLGPSAGACRLGSCQPIALAVGGVCEDGGLACPSGASCVGGICRLAGAAGGACELDADCGGALACNFDHDGNGTCGAAPTAGQACVVAGEPCADLGTWCRTVGIGKAGVAEAACVPTAGLGESCVPEGVVRAGALCRAGTTCSGASGVCVALPPVEAACPDHACAPGGYCALDAAGTGNVCLAPHPLGTACRADAECAAGTCANDGHGGPTVCTAVTTCAR